MFGIGYVTGTQRAAQRRKIDIQADETAHWLTGIWASTSSPNTYLAFLPNQTFVEFLPGYSGTYPETYRISPKMSFEADYPRGEEGEAETKRSQFELAENAQLLIVPAGALNSHATKFKRLTDASPWVSGLDVPTVRPK